MVLFGYIFKNMSDNIDKTIIIKFSTYFLLETNILIFSEHLSVLNVEQIWII